jgi:hypothetical protein
MTLQSACSPSAGALSPEKRQREHGGDHDPSLFTDGKVSPSRGER